MHPTRPPSEDQINSILARAADAAGKGAKKVGEGIGQIVTNSLGVPIVIPDGGDKVWGAQKPGEKTILDAAGHITDRIKVGTPPPNMPASFAPPPEPKHEVVPEEPQPYYPAWGG